MENGADLDAKDNDGKTAKDIAPQIFSPAGDKEPEVDVESVAESETTGDAAESDEPMEVESNIEIEASVTEKTDIETTTTSLEKADKATESANPTKPSENHEPAEKIGEQKEEDKTDDMTQRSETDFAKNLETDLAQNSEMADKKETEVVNGTTSDKEPVAINQDVTKTSEKSEESVAKEHDQIPSVNEPESMDLIESTPELEIPSPTKRAALKSPRKSQAKPPELQGKNSPSIVRKPEARTSLKFSAFPKPVAGSENNSFTALKAGGRRGSLPSSRGALLLQMSKKSSAKSENDLVNSRLVCSVLT